jgi:hypothetical protein
LLNFVDQLNLIFLDDEDSDLVLLDLILILIESVLDILGFGADQFSDLVVFVFMEEIAYHWLKDENHPGTCKVGGKKVFSSLHLEMPCLLEAL